MDYIKRDALRFLEGLESGQMPIVDAYNIADELDPVLVYMIIRYLREKYPAGRPTSEGVSSRLLELTSTYSSVVQASKRGESDPVTQWFLDAYACSEFFSKPEEFIDMLVEKIEG